MASEAPSQNRECWGKKSLTKDTFAPQPDTVPSQNINMEYILRLVTKVTQTAVQEVLQASQHVRTIFVLTDERKQHTMTIGIQRPSLKRKTQSVRYH